MIKTSSRHLLLGLVWGLFMCLFQTMGRAIFILFFSAKSLPQSEIAHAFLMGFRFDAAIVAYCLLLYLILAWGLRLKKDSLWPVRILIGFSVLIFLITTANFGFYSYFHDHFNVRIYELFLDDTWAIAVTSWRDLPVLRALAALVLFIWLLRLALQFSARMIDHMLLDWSPPLLKAIGILALSFVSLFFIGRGSLNLAMPPLGRMNIDVSHPFLNQAAFNPIFALVDAFKKGGSRSTTFDLIQAMGFQGRVLDAYRTALGRPELQSLEEARKQYWQSTLAPKKKATPPHVVVFLMESMGRYWLDFNSPEFPILAGLERHFERDGLWRNFLPSCSGTYCTLAYMLLNAPTLPGPNLTEVRALPEVFPSGAAQPFRRSGYRTLFVYGGALGWRDLSNLVPRLGFDEQAGSQQIKQALGKKEYHEHDWGIMDEHVMEYVHRELVQADRPTMIFVLTTTNHPPFQIPPDYEGPRIQTIPPALESRMAISHEKFLARMSCFQYANHQVALFMDAVKGSDLKDTTIVAVTGDHNFFDVTAFSADEFADWKGVPLYLYIPPEIRPDLDQKQWASQDDIFPTLYDLALPGTKALYFGRSLLSSSRKPVAINHEGLIYGSLLLHQGQVYRQNGSTTRFKLTEERADLGDATNAQLWLEAHYVAVYDSLTAPHPDGFLPRARR